MSLLAFLCIKDLLPTTQNTEKENKFQHPPIAYRVHLYSSALYVSCLCTVYIPSQNLLYLIPLLLSFSYSTTVFY